MLFIVKFNGPELQRVSETFKNVFLVLLLLLCVPPGVGNDQILAEIGLAKIHLLSRLLNEMQAFLLEVTETTS